MNADGVSTDGAGEALDVSELKSFAFGARSTLFWATTLLCVSEGTVLAILFTSYLYLRDNFDTWPPSLPLRLAPGIASTGVLLLSLVPITLVGRAARDLDLKRTRRWQLVSTLVGIVGLALRFWETRALPFTWSENAYASVVWTSFGAHMVDYVVEVGECVVLTALLFRGPLEEKHFEDVEVNAFFWAFLVVAWLPFAGLFYGEGVR